MADTLEALGLDQATARQVHSACVGSAEEEAHELALAIVRDGGRLSRQVGSGGPMTRSLPA